MRIRLLLTDVNAHPTDRPRGCRYCEGAILHRHGTLKKPIRDHRSTREVEVHRYKCLSCGRTFRHYPAGVSGKDQSERTVVLAALMYALGLSCSATSHLLWALGAGVSKMTVWRDAQEAGEALRRKRPEGRVRVIGADETVFSVKGEEVVVGFVVDAGNGKTLGFEVLFAGDGGAFRRWLEPYAKELGAEVLVSDDNDSYALAAAELGLRAGLVSAAVRGARKEVRKQTVEVDPRAGYPRMGRTRPQARKTRGRPSRAKGAAQGASRAGRKKDRTVAPGLPLGRSAHEGRPDKPRRLTG